MDSQHTPLVWRDEGALALRDVEEHQVVVWRCVVGVFDVVEDVDGLFGVKKAKKVPNLVRHDE
jgi:hypothetical protein